MAITVSGFRFSQVPIFHKSERKIFFVEHVIDSTFHKYLTLFFPITLTFLSVYMCSFRCVSVVFCSKTHRQTHTFMCIYMHTYSKTSEGNRLVDTSGFMCDTINQSNREINIMSSSDYGACAACYRSDPVHEMLE